jgi:MFS family permease
VSRSSTHRVFYGWWIVLAGAIIAALVGGPAYFGLGAFFAPIQSELRWSYATISWAFTLQMLVAGVGSLLIGWLFDRFGPRVLVFSGVGLAGFGFFLVSRIRSAVDLDIAFAILGTGAAAATFLVLNSAVTLWFRRGVGRALAVLQTGYGVGGLAAPGCVALILGIGWRPAALVVAIVTVGLGLPAALFLKRPPDEDGVLALREAPEGNGVPHPERGESVTQSYAGFRTRDAVKSWAFWSLLIILVLSTGLTEVVYVHQIRALIAFGVRPETAGTMTAAAALIGLLGRYGFGWLSDSSAVRYLFAVALGMQACGVLALSQIYGTVNGAGALFVILFGIGQGGIFLLTPIVQREWFGTRNFGTIQGLLLGPAIVLSAVAPLLIGAFVDRYGTYRPAFLLCGSVGFLLVGLALSNRVPADYGVPSPQNAQIGAIADNPQRR